MSGGKARRVVVYDGGTIGDVRAFLAEVDRAGLPDDTPVHVKTRPSMSWLGPKVTRLGVDGPTFGSTG